MMGPVETLVHLMSGVHVFLGVLSVCVGVVSCIRADIWLAHSVSPIWSGGFFILAGILGIWCTRRKSSYVIKCFTAFSVVSIVTAVVSIQLLRVGLVNHTTDGHTFQRENQDVLIFISLAAAGAEILVCTATIILSFRVAKLAKVELDRKREGMFHVKVLGQKDIVVVTQPVYETDDLIAV